MSLDTLLLGHSEPSNRGMPEKTYPLTSPFYHERDQWHRDPFYRRGIVGGLLTRQFLAAPFGTISRFLLATLAR